MRRFICALIVCGTLANIESARASSIVFDFSGLVSSDVYTSPVPGPPYSGYYPSTRYQRMLLEKHFSALLVFLMSTLLR
jgi:hypothetical protein